MMDQCELERVREAFEQWELYEAVIRHDYMLHQSLSCAINQYGRAVRVSGSVLDLGCGDAWMAHHSLESLPFRRYTGVDLSESALERAAARLEVWPQPYSLHQQDMAEFVGGLPNESMDLVLASYSIHHFESAAKQQLLREISRVLKPGGRFIWSEIVRGATESRLQYLDRLEEEVRRDWGHMTPEQCDHIADHIRSSDYPETASWMVGAAKSVGLKLDRMLLGDAFFSSYAFIR